ncbi:zinc finger family protein [Musa troglodytarum]|uniref:Zinc finger family protein n=1 Tax=Musa troglodytarum TaxID=320322 RepID=A0A9E7G2X9_9LILI|nr:zinc finger family protein [Musa troglodytarum]
MIMAGMLPGVECARRRRFHTAGSVDSLTSCSRRSAFALCTTGHDMHPSSSSISMRSIMNKEIHEEALGHTAREARERLDARLRIKRHNSLGSMKLGESEGCSHGRLHRILGSVQRQVFSSKKSTGKFSWSKLRWKASEQADCAVCLEDFQEGDMLVHLPCAHRFHWNCVLPWLESSSHCPCCRMTIFLG